MNEQKKYSLEELVLGAIFSLQADYEGDLLDVCDIFLDRGEAALERASMLRGEDSQMPLDGVVLRETFVSLLDAYAIKYRVTEDITKEYLESCLDSKNR